MAAPCPSRRPRRSGWRRGSPPACRWRVFTIDIQTGARRSVTRSKDWLNHVQFSPKDPTLLMYCHEGPWEKVDRIWTIRTDGSARTKVHQRRFQGEIAGHEYWAPDGRTIWYDLIQPQGVRWLAGHDVVSGARRWLRIGPGQGSYHYSSTPDGRSFSGDGNDEGKYISLFHPRLDDSARARGTLDAAARHCRAGPARSQNRVAQL